LIWKDGQDQRDPTHSNINDDRSHGEKTKDKGDDVKTLLLMRGVQLTGTVSATHAKQAWLPEKGAEIGNRPGQLVIDLHNFTNARPDGKLLLGDV
jgi:hypothetical protein